MSSHSRHALLAELEASAHDRELDTLVRMGYARDAAEIALFDSSDDLQLAKRTLEMNGVGATPFPAGVQQTSSAPGINAAAELLESSVEPHRWNSLLFSSRSSARAAGVNV